MTKQFLKENNVAYEFLDVDLLEEEVDKDKVRNEILKRSGSVGFPTIIVDDNNVITGFQKEQIKKVLKI